MSDEKSALKGVWEVVVENHDTGEVTTFESGNIIVNLAREEGLKDLFGVGAISAFTHLGIGTGSTAAAAADTTLQTEVTTGSTRYALTDSSGGAIDSGDVATEVSGAYNRKIVVKAVVPTGDLNGSALIEFAIFSAITGGTMLNRFVLGSAINKTSSITVTVQITLRM